MKFLVDLQSFKSMMSTLESIDLSDTSVPDSCIEMLFKKYIHLKNFALENCTEISPKLLVMFMNCDKSKLKLNFSR
jgi:hypothetical protein